MWPWFGGWHPWGWHWGGAPYGYGYPPSYGYPWAIPKEEEIRILEDQERCLTTELEGVRKRLSELRGQ
jgi:predicted NAD/FAD-binding protein